MSSTEKKVSAAKVQPRKGQKNILMPMKSSEKNISLM